MTRALPCLLVLLAACSPARYVRSADREVTALLADYEERVLADREQSVDRPTQLPPEPEPDPDAPDDAEPEAAAADVLVLDLEGALELAVSQGRDFVLRQETLYLAGLGLSATRFQFGPQLDTAVNLVWSDRLRGPRSYSLGTTAGVSQILPTGGTLRVDGGLATARVEGPHLVQGIDDPDKGRSFSSDAGVSFTQPLLRGAGYAVSHESLVQGERDLMYAIRDFELFRQDFSIQITAAYFDLVNEKKSLAIQRGRANDAANDYQKSLALRQMERNKKNDVFVARRTANQEENRLIEDETTYQRNLDRFAIDLGLPRGTRIDVVETTPPFEVVRDDPASAVEVALRNRLDIQTRRDRVEDTERGLRLSANDLLPDLDVILDYGRSAAGGRRIGDGVVDLDSNWSSNAAVSLRIPVQQNAERNAYRRAMISLDQERRSFEEFLDTEVAEIEDLLRQLQRSEQQITLQRELIESEQETIAVVQIQLESGEASNRDLAEARQSVADARNQLNQLESNHFVNRLRLARALGILFVDEKGMWR